MKTEITINYGDIFYAELSNNKDSHIQSGVRPVLVISNNKNNTYSTVIQVVPLTSSQKKAKLPTHIDIDGFGLHKKSTILAEQILSIDKWRFKSKIGSVVGDKEMMGSIIDALRIQLNLIDVAA